LNAKEEQSAFKKVRRN